MYMSYMIIHINMWIERYRQIEPLTLKLEVDRRTGRYESSDPRALRKGSLRAPEGSRSLGVRASVFN